MTIRKLITGYKNFYARNFAQANPTYKKLAEGQSPRVAMIACSDSRVDPSIITDADLGEIFVIRNVANLVPPYQPDDHTYHGTSAALEFAVNNLKVEHIVVLGHSKCAGIRALLADTPHTGEQSFVHSWMRIADDVKQEICSKHAQLPIEEKAYLSERKAIERSLANLTTFPWIRDKIAAGELALHGWHFDLDEGDLSCYDYGEKSWKRLT